MGMRYGDDTFKVTIHGFGPLGDWNRDEEGGSLDERIGHRLDHGVRPVSPGAEGAGPGEADARSPGAVHPGGGAGERPGGDRGDGQRDGRIRFRLIECRSCQERAWMMGGGPPEAHIQDRQWRCPGLGGFGRHDWWEKFTFFARDEGPGLHPTQEDTVMPDAPEDIYDGEKPTISMVLSLSFERMSAVNGARCERWHEPLWREPDDSWTLADWSNAMCGEAGEAANVVKKMRRIESDLWDKRKYPGDSVASDIALADANTAYGWLREKLGDELADLILYADLLAQKAGLNLGECVRAKFNRVSEAQGFPERL